MGSFALGAPTRPRLCIDLALEIPAACLDQKDQLNHRYHAKRALYLAHLVGVLKGQPRVAAVSWDSFAGDPRKPALVLHPEERVSPGGFTIRLLPALPAEAFPLARLGPDRNNLRSASKEGSGPAAKDGSSAGKGGQAQQQLLPTPHYNASVLQVNGCWVGMRALPCILRVLAAAGSGGNGPGRVKSAQE